MFQLIRQDETARRVLTDLRNLSTIMDVASTRGAFRANEMAMVGALYNKLQSFLARVSPKDEKADGSAPTETPAKE